MQKNNACFEFHHVIRQTALILCSRKEVSLIIGGCFGKCKLRFLQVWPCSSCVCRIWKLFFFSFLLGIKSVEVVVSVQGQQDRKCVTGCLTLWRCLHQMLAQRKPACPVCVCECVLMLLTSCCLQPGWEIPAQAARCCCSLSPGRFGWKPRVPMWTKHPVDSFKMKN